MSNKLTPHPHAEVIKAWADGHKIEYKLSVEKEWTLIAKPTFQPDIEYRIYKEPKPDVVLIGKVILYPDSIIKGHIAFEKPISTPNGWVSDIQITVDGETGKPKAVSLVND